MWPTAASEVAGRFAWCRRAADSIAASCMVGAPTDVYQRAAVGRPGAAAYQPWSIYLLENHPRPHAARAVRRQRNEEEPRFEQPQDDRRPIDALVRCGDRRGATAGHVRNL
jgi:hypothetical protein